MIRIRVPASTSNLGAGFDTFGLALELYLTVKINPAAKANKIQYKGPNSKSVVLNEKNLVFATAARLFQQAKESMPPVEIQVENNIPLQRGLGSSGAAIVAGLVGANQLLKKPFATENLLSRAIEQEGHPENVSASLLGGLTISCMQGSRHFTRQVSVTPKLNTVVLVPEVGVSTTEARRALPARVSHKDAVFNVQRSALLSHAFIRGDFSILKELMQDKLHQPYRKEFIPEYGLFERTAYEAGALGVCISGSGSTIIAFVQKNGLEVEKAWQEVAASEKITARTICLKISNSGTIIC